MSVSERPQKIQLNRSRSLDEKNDKSNFITTELHTGQVSDSQGISTPQILTRTPTLPTAVPPPVTGISLSDSGIVGDTSYPIRISLPARPLTPVDSNSSTQSKPFFPTEIQCDIFVTFTDKDYEPEAQRFTIQNFRWYEKKSFDDLKVCLDEALDAVKPKSEYMAKEQIYFRYGSCCVKSETDETKYSPDMAIDSEEHMHQVAQQDICGFIYQHPWQSFTLMIFYDYSSIQIEPGEDSDGEEEDFGITMRAQYRRKMHIPKPTITKQRFISIADLNALTTEEISSRLIDEDRSLALTKRPGLKAEVSKRAAGTLLAVCVNKSIPLKYLYHLLFSSEHYSTDNSLPRFESIKSCKFCRRADHGEVFLEEMYKFYPLAIEYDRKYHKRAPEEVVPVHYIVSEHIPLGNGAFSNVFEVGIDPACRGRQLSTVSVYSSGSYMLTLVQDQYCKYALKVFTSIDKTPFEREMRMLLSLAKHPHEHILTHVTSWEQNGKYYILYDKANHGNLRELMGNVKGGDLRLEKVIWFLRQLRGIADAIRRIHQWKEPKLDIFSQEPEKDVSTEKPGIAGRHHDIKPENILGFGKQDQLPRLKISDFGAGKFSTVGKHESRGASKALGTLTYFGPEYEKGSGMSRPFDMWALGCVFLEFLLWFLDMEQPIDGRTFLELRSDPHGKIDVDFFWTVNRLGYPELHPNVRKILDHLENNACSGMLAFTQVIRQIRLLLDVDSKKRTRAVDLANSLDAILSQAKIDLHSKPKHYADAYRENRGQDADSISDIANGPPPQLPIPRGYSREVSFGTSRKSSSEDLKIVYNDREVPLKPEDMKPHPEEFKTYTEVKHDQSSQPSGDEDPLVMEPLPRSQVQNIEIDLNNIGPEREPWRPGSPRSRTV